MPVLDAEAVLEGDAVIEDEGVPVPEPVAEEEEDEVVELEAVSLALLVMEGDAVLEEDGVPVPVSEDDAVLEAVTEDDGVLERVAEEVAVGVLLGEISGMTGPAPLASNGCPGCSVNPPYRANRCPSTRCCSVMFSARLYTIRVARSNVEKSAEE